MKAINILKSDNRCNSIILELNYKKSTLDIGFKKPAYKSVKSIRFNSLGDRG